MLSRFNLYFEWVLIFYLDMVKINGKIEFKETSVSLFIESPVTPNPSPFALSNLSFCLIDTDFAMDSTLMYRIISKSRDLKHPCSI